jgi:hypothetical protein
MNYHDFIGISKNKAFMKDYIEGSIKTMTLDEISSEVKTIKEDVYKTLVDSRIKRYHDLLESKQSSDDLIEIKHALIDGKVETLIISENAKMDLKKHIHSETINKLILLAITNGSKLVLANQSNMPENKNVRAIFRYI